MVLLAIGVMSWGNIYLFIYFSLIAGKDLGRDMMGTLLLQVPLKCLVEDIMTLLVLLLEVCICSNFVPEEIRQS